MSDPSKDAIFLSLGIEPGDVLNEQLKAWTPPPPQTGEDRICLLIPARGHTAAKTYEKLETGGIKVTEWDAGRRFTAVEIRVRCAWDLFRALKATAESGVESFAVRGAISDAGRSALDQRGFIFRRSSEAHPEAKRHLADRPSRVFIVDVDHWALPPGVAPTDLEGQAASAIAELAAIEPSLAHGTLFFQASNSAGQSTETFSLKIWGWLVEPTTTEDFRGWTNAMNAAFGAKALDPKQARAVQPIYQHCPRFSGMRDPMLGGRWLYQHRGGGEIAQTLSRGPKLVSSPPPGDAGRLHVATGKDAPYWKARLRADLGVSGCYGAIHAAVYAAVAFGASDEEIIGEIRADTSDGRKFHNARWSPAYVREKTSPSFVAPMIRDARAREGERSKRIASAFADLRGRLGLGEASSAEASANPTTKTNTDQAKPKTRAQAQTTGER